ncbi:copper homeostasis protein cutC, partial [Metarhizium majus ARSEF 297]
MIARETTQMPLEVAVFSGESALKAQSQGASRVELNAPGSYHVGGTTPPIAELKRIAAKVTIPVRIMIRPRGAPGDGSPDFVYTPKEVAAMAQSIRDFKATGLLNPFRGDGFVFGLLQPTPAAAAEDPLPGGEPDAACALRVDHASCRALLDAARPFGCVFHRAFDPIAATRRIGDGVEALVRLGFEGLLTAQRRPPRPRVPPAGRPDPVRPRRRPARVQRRARGRPLQHLREGQRVDAHGRPEQPSRPPRRGD